MTRNSILWIMDAYFYVLVGGIRLVIDGLLIMDYELKYNGFNNYVRE